MIRVDRIEGDVAVVEIDGQCVDVSVRLLPPGTTEGATLRLVRDEDATQTARERARARMERLAAQSDLPDEIEL